MVECNLFELAVDVEGHGDTPQVRYFVYTDLPAGTKQLENNKSPVCMILGWSRYVKGV
jgi:hypothetical protein